mgnify:CR=1 FL=1
MLALFLGLISLAIAILYSSAYDKIANEIRDIRAKCLRIDKIYSDINKSQNNTENTKTQNNTENTKTQNNNEQFNSQEYYNNKNYKEQFENEYIVEEFS